MSPTESFGFGSISGTTFAFYFFLCLAGFIGFAVYELCRNPAVRKLGGVPTTRRTALLSGSVVALLVFLGVYFSSLDGFYRLDVQGEQLRLAYILPGRLRIVGRRDIAGVTQRPAYKSLWQLSIRTRSGDEFTSARSDFGRVSMARQRLAPVADSRERSRPQR